MSKIQQEISVATVTGNEFLGHHYQDVFTEANPL